jgi:hypothetical protein
MAHAWTFSNWACHSQWRLASFFTYFCIFVFFLNHVFYIYFKIISINIPSLWFFCGCFLIILYVFRFWRYYSNSSIIFLCFIWLIFILKNKNYLFLDSISNKYNLIRYFSFYGFIQLIFSYVIILISFN